MNNVISNMFELSEELPWSGPLLFAIVVDVVTENAREGLMKEVLCEDDLVRMNETM